MFPPRNCRKSDRGRKLLRPTRTVKRERASDRLHTHAYSCSSPGDCSSCSPSPPPPSSSSAHHARRPGRLHPGHDRRRPAADWQAVADPDGAGRLGAQRNGRRCRPTCASRSAFPSRPWPATSTPPCASSRSAARRARVAGLVFRAQSASDYYVVRADALDDSVRLYRMRARPGAASSPARRRRSRAGQWHSLRVIASNDRFEVSLDGKPLFDGHRPQPAAARHHGRLEPGRQRHPLRLAAGRPAA